MKKIFAVVVLLLGLMPFSAQAGFFGKDEWEKEDCPKNHSLAWCLADYQGRSKGIRDISREEFAETLKKAGVDESHIGDIIGTGLGVGAGIGNLALGNLFGGGVFLMSALLTSPEESNKKYPYVIFFDAAAGRTETQVADDFRIALGKATNKSLSVLPAEAKVAMIMEGELQITMPDHKCKNGLNCLVTYSTERFLVENKSVPAYIGGQEVVSTRTGSSYGVGMFNLPKGVNAAILAKTISENLPASYYWFIPAGHLGGNPFPLMLNQGNALFFVKPSPGDTAAILPHVAAKQKGDDRPVVQSAPDSPPPEAMQTSSLVH